MPPAFQLLAAAIGGGVLGQIVSALATRKQAGADAAKSVTEAAALIATSSVAGWAELVRRVEKAEEHAIKAVADVYLARQAEDECKRRLTELERQVDDLRTERLA